MRWKIVLLALLTVGLHVPPTSSGDDSTGDGYTLNALKALGHEVAPKACGKVKHNLFGATLASEFYGHKMVPQAKYTLKCGDWVLGQAVADEDGLLVITAVVTDPDTLKAIAANANRKFDLWQGQHRVSRSADVFDFEFIQE
jgi:hypothetical protein